MEETGEDGYLPKIRDFILKVIYTNQQADELVADGFKFRQFDDIRRERLDRGAIGFCIFVGQELANIGWVAMNEEAQRSILDLPIKVDFSNNEAFLGSGWTHPKYRGMRLHGYNLFKRLQFLREKGVAIQRSVAKTRNIASQKGSNVFSPKIYAESRYLKILWWKFWKETPTNAELSEKLGSQ